MPSTQSAKETVEAATYNNTAAAASRSESDMKSETVTVNTSFIDTSE
jgi:hypothetical protein